MESFEVLRETIREPGVKTVASEMKLSSSLVYKWCEMNDGSRCGADNPLDRIARICAITDDDAPVSWLCQQVGGFLVRNPLNVKATDTPILRATQTILKEFSEVLDAVAKSFDDDGKVDKEEAGKIRNEWEELKEVTESFVVSCEHGVYENE